jgi:Ser/Thr protein kinase RdoA (MazF antagonist)
MQSLYDFRIHRGMLGFGPFANEADFHRFEGYGLQLEYDILGKEKAWIEADEVDELRRMIEIQDGKNRKICFTRGDLNGANILVRKGKVAAIIDFDLSGFYPEYWEYTTAMVGISGEEFWKEEISRFLDVYPEELEMESIRQKHFGRGGYQGRYKWY